MRRYINNEKAESSVGMDTRKRCGNSRVAPVHYTLSRPSMKDAVERAWRTACRGQMRGRAGGACEEWCKGFSFLKRLSKCSGGWGAFCVLLVVDTWRNGRNTGSARGKRRTLPRRERWGRWRRKHGSEVGRRAHVIRAARICQLQKKEAVGNHPHNVCHLSACPRVALVPSP